MKIYAEDTSSNLIHGRYEEIKTLIERESEDYVLNVGENQYVEHLKNRFTFDFPEILRDQAYIDSYETDIPGHRFPPEYMVLDRAKLYKKDIIVYHVPYTGDINLLRYRPNTFTSNIGVEIDVDINTQSIKFSFIKFTNEADKMKRLFEDALGDLYSCYGYLRTDINEFNRGLENYIRTTLNNRKKQLLRRSDFIASLGVPVRSNSTTPKTFSIPNPPLREKISVKPIVSVKGFKPEPTLDEENYSKILGIINDVGKNFERLPSVYSGKGEEDLRDHILMILDPNFEYGSASGETFNKSGKTDILLRYDSSVVFIAECKFWSGEKKFLDTIDQLLGYLTWRDSKTAVVVFVRNRDMSSVIKSAEAAVKKHSNFIAELPGSSASWFNYVFSLPQDANKEIKLAIQLFHLP